MTRLFGVHSGVLSGKEAAHRLFWASVRQIWGWADIPAIVVGEQGKPIFLDFPDLHFNLSHSGNFALCVLSDEGPAGVDIEIVRKHRAGLPDYVMSPAERKQFDGSWEDFTRIWTLKESYVKFLGQSIYPPRKVPVPPPVPWRSYEGPDWRAALCTVGTLPKNIEWESLPFL